PWFDFGPSGNSDNGTYTYPNYPAKDPRIVILPVCDPSPADNNNPQLTARYFAAVYLMAVVGRGGETYLRMRILPGYTFDNEDPNIVLGDETTPDIGFSVIRLIG